MSFLERGFEHFGRFGKQALDLRTRLCQKAITKSLDSLRIGLVGAEPVTMLGVRDTGERQSFFDGLEFEESPEDLFLLKRKSVARRKNRRLK